MSGTDPVDFVVPAFAEGDVVRNIRRDEAALAARLRNDGFREGYSRGLERAQDEVDASISDHRANAERLARLVDALEHAVADLRARDAAVLADTDQQVLGLAVELAEGLIGRELEMIERAVVDSMARALAVKPDRGTPVIRVHPTDQATAREAADAGLVQWGSDVTVLADDRIEPGGCIVDVDACRIDAQIGPALARLRSVH